MRKELYIPSIAFVALSALFILSFIVHMTMLPGPDIAWHMYVAEQILSGKHLYKDIIEVNMPMIYYLRVPVVMLAKETGISGSGLVLWFHFSFAAFSLWLGWQAISRSSLYTEGVFHCVTMGVLCFVILFPFVDFGLKEHLFMVFTLPYFLCIGLNSRFDSKLLKLSVGIMAALGLCIKPLFILYFAAVELMDMLSRRKFTTWIRIETLTIAVILLSYGIFVLVRYPDYITDTAPLIEYGYRFYRFQEGWGLWAMIHTQFFALVGYSAPLLLLWAIFNPNRFTVGGGVLVLLALGSVAMQSKGWDYHLYPAVVLTFLLYCPALASLIDEVRRVFAIQGRQFGVKTGFDFVVVSGLLFALVFNSAVSYLRFTEDAPEARRYIDNIKDAVDSNAVRERSVMVFGRIEDAFPLVTVAHLTWTSRFNSLWLVEAMRTAQGSSVNKEYLDKYSQFARQSVVEDLRQYQPKILVEREGIDYRGVLSASPAFVQEMRHYRKIKRFQVREKSYAIYLRKTENSPIS